MIYVFGNEFNILISKYRFFLMKCIELVLCNDLVITASVSQGPCQNVITVIEKFQDSLFVCGTNGHKPQCWKLVSVCTSCIYIYQCLTFSVIQ